MQKQAGRQKLQQTDEMIGNAVSRCFGVASIGPQAAARHGLRALLKRRRFGQHGVRVYRQGSGLVVDLQIVLDHGRDISAVAHGVTNKVCYTAEQTTGLSVRRVNVFIDGMRGEG